jgi:DNA polymerase-3 subunit epsilon
MKEVVLDTETTGISVKDGHRIVEIGCIELVSLDALCKRYRIDNSKRTQHTALIDCDLLAKVYINLIDQKEPTLDFQNQDNEIIEKNVSGVVYFKKVIEPTSEELKKHKEYLKNNLKKNFY